MEFYEVVKSRRTIRDFTEKKVDMKIIKKILSAGLMAPANGGARHWEFVVITDKEMIEKITNPIPQTASEKEMNEIFGSWKKIPQLQKEGYLNAIPKQYKMLIESGCLILPFFKQHQPLFNSKKIFDLNGFASIWCCIENILLAATAEKLGCTIRIPLEKETEHVFETLKHPKDYVMPCFLAIGYPMPKVKTQKQIKPKVEERIHHNKW